MDSSKIYWPENIRWVTAMKLKFCGYTDYEEGKLARVETIESGIPVNIHAEDDSDFGMKSGEICIVDIYAVGSDISVYSSEEEYKNSGNRMAAVSMIPMGTFSVNPEDENFKQSAQILYTGKAAAVEKSPQGDDENAPNYLLKIQTYEMEFQLYTHYDGIIKTGYIVHGIAWLFGDILR